MLRRIVFQCTEQQNSYLPLRMANTTFLPFSVMLFAQEKRFYHIKILFSQTSFLTNKMAMANGPEGN
jgi:hypothetical protein